MDNPLVTLYMLSYNRKQYVREAFESMLQQTYSPLEIIVSDGHSTDGTYELIQQMAQAYKGCHQIRISRNERDLGLIGNLNKVFTLMRGELLIINCDDDISMPDKVTRIVESWVKYDKKPTAIAVSSTIIDQKGEQVGRFDLGKERLLSRSLVSFMRLGCPNGMYGGTGAAFAYSKKMIDTFGPITTRFTADDAVMVRRAYLLGPILILPDLLFKYRVGDGLSTRRSDTFRRETIRQRWVYNTLKQIKKDVRIVQLPSKTEQKIMAILIKEMSMELACSKMWRMRTCSRIILFFRATKWGMMFFEFPRQTLRLALRSIRLA